MRSSFDGDLRRLERAHRAAPDDQTIARRYMQALKRAGHEEPALTLQFQLGERAEACAALAIRWEADLTRLPKGLCWRDEPFSQEDLCAMVGEDLERFDPVLLAAEWSTRQDGAFRLNTTQFLRRYQAHEPDAPHRRLILIAWTPGTSTLYERPKDRGKHVITVGLETRSTNRKLYPPAKWRS